MSVIERNNIHIRGSGTRPILFSHGFGCDQNMWRFVWPAFEKTHQVVLFDQVGAGRSDLSKFDQKKYSTLKGYASDVIEICESLKLRNVIYVGHSVSAMIGVLAAIEKPQYFDKLVLIGPSPRYINDGAYIGGFSQKDIEDFLNVLDSNYLGWSSQMAPVIMGVPDRPELGTELKESFCRTHPDIAKQFARVTFLSDNRADLAKVNTPTLILQCSNDVIAPNQVGEYVHREISGSYFVQLSATGHCPNLSAPEETIRAIQSFLDQPIV